MSVAFADDLNFEGHDLVEPDCDAMSSWFECRDIDTAPPGVFLGYLYMHHTSETLGPGRKHGLPRHWRALCDDGDSLLELSLPPGVMCPSALRCTSHRARYQPDSQTGLGPYFRPLGYHRDLEDSVIDCFPATA